jgi:hypothetical protein
MPLISILVMAWLVSTPAYGAVSFPQDTPAASSTQSPASAPADPTQTAPTKGEPPAAKQGATDSAAKKKSKGAPASQRLKRHRVRNRARAGEPRKTVVREGGAIEPPAHIVPGLAPQEAGQQRQNTEDLLRLTEESLKQLAGRTLDSLRQKTVAQIHNYVDGARSALKDGDTQRAHTLALKAHLLADDLLKH